MEFVGSVLFCDCADGCDRLFEFGEDALSKYEIACLLCVHRSKIVVNLIVRRSIFLIGRDVVSLPWIEIEFTYEQCVPSDDAEPSLVTGRSNDG